MAWVDDRIWCHPKFADLSPAARWLWVCGVTYSSGFATKGALSRGQQQTIGTTKKTLVELVQAGLWEPLEDGSVQIHDWDEHNSKRDERRAKDRERKRRERTQARMSEGQSAGQTADKRSDRRALKEVKEVTTRALLVARPERPEVARIRELIDEAISR